MPTGQAIRRSLAHSGMVWIAGRAAGRSENIFFLAPPPDGAAMTDSGSDDVAVIVYREDDAWDVDLLPPPSPRTWPG